MKRSISIMASLILGGVLPAFAGDLSVDNLAVSSNAVFSGTVAIKTTISDPVLLLHCNGTDASTNFTDSSVVARAVTASGNAQIDTAITKHGTAAALFDGSGDYLATADSADWDFGTGDFTIDGWVNSAATPSVVRLIAAGANNGGANNMWFLGFGNGWGGGFKMNFGYYNGSGYTEYYAGSAFGVTNGTWNHWALVRSGGYIYCFWNGVRNVNWNMGSSVVINSGVTGLILGARYNANTGDVIEYLNGSMDEIRVSKGFAKWTSDFTPPTSEYQAGIYTNASATNVILNVEGSTIISGDITTLKVTITTNSGDIGMGSYTNKP